LVRLIPLGSVKRFYTAYEHVQTGYEDDAKEPTLSGFRKENKMEGNVAFV
jgi:hypothetical protein